LALRRVLIGAAAMLAAALGNSAMAQQDPAAGFPDRPLHIVVGFTAGGGNDILARLIGEKISQDWHQPVLVENKPGASGIIAAGYVAKAPADGTTLLMGPSGSMTINPVVYDSLPYDTLRDFAPVSMVASFPLYLVVRPGLPVHSATELVAYARANPEKANYGAASTAFQLATELFKIKTGAPLEYIPYKGSSEMVVAVIAGEVLTTMADAPPVSGQLQQGQLRGLAVTAAQRSAQFLDIPTMAEAGVPDMEVTLWSGLFAPAATPPAIVAKWQDEVARVVHLPEIRDRMATLAVEPVGDSPAEFRTVIEGDLARWASVAKAAHVKILQ